MAKQNKNVVILLLIVIALSGVWWLLNKESFEPTVQQEVIEVPIITTNPTEPPPPIQDLEIIGHSVENREIISYRFGEGETDLLFVGGVHGGYEWNSTLLAYEMIEHFKKNESEIPENITIHIIPNLNPDGLFKATGLEGEFTVSEITDYEMHTTGEGRFNANNVDLNRNFDCKWAPESSWKGQTVSAGTEPFSEPEAAALRDYVNLINPSAVLFWHSKANNVYASECEEGVLPETITLMNTYARAANYGAVPSFDAYPVTGDAEGWLASIGIPAVTIEMEGRVTTEWERNLAGTEAVLEHYSTK